MKSLKNILLSSSLILLALLLASCVATSTTGKQDSGLAAQESLEPAVESALLPTPPPPPATLPVRYQRASYFVDQEDRDHEEATLAEESALKVGARITSTSGPQPLWDIMKRLAALKGMNVSWASDVDRNVLVDVNISAQDDFSLAIDNLLRQVDYYHEMVGSTIIVKYKETRQFHIAMPFVKHTYRTNTGGDVLGGSDGEASTTIKGEISLMTDGVAINNLRDGTPGSIEFNTWHSIENNLNAVLDIWTTEEVDASIATSADNTSVDLAASELETSTSRSLDATFRRSKTGNRYFIDKPVGLISVTAPRPIQERLEAYFTSLKRELYKQISIEAKIIEVQLDDFSSIGLNWNKIFENLSLGGTFQLTDNYSKETTDNRTSELTNTRSYSIVDESIRTRGTGFNNTLDTALSPVNRETSRDSSGSDFTSTVNNTIGSLAESTATAAKFITDISTTALVGTAILAPFTFDSFVKAVDQQGETTILSNPKLSVMNGQPALMTVGRNETYIDMVETTQSEGVISTSVTTARALSGVGLALTANILDDGEIILNLVPVTSEVEDIPERVVGNSIVGLPIINVRQMSTTVRVKDGEMLVIGGLITGFSNNNESFIPWTNNIPFFKYLFGYEEKRERKRELIILLQPRII